MIEDADGRARHLASADLERLHQLVVGEDVPWVELREAVAPHGFGGLVRVATELPIGEHGRRLPSLPTC